MYLYFLTCEHQTMAGVYRLPPAYGADDLGWPKEEFMIVLQEVVERGLVHRDEETCEILIDGWFTFNPPKGKPTIKGIENSLEKLESGTLFEMGMQAFEKAIQEQAENNIQNAQQQVTSQHPDKANGMTPDQLLNKKRDFRLSQQQPSKGY